MNNKFEFVINQKIIKTEDIKNDFFKIETEDLNSFSMDRDIQTVRSVSGLAIDMLPGPLTYTFTLILSPKKFPNLLERLTKNQGVLYQDKLFWVTQWNYEHNTNDLEYKIVLECIAR
jgi:hypothetical protein